MLFEFDPMDGEAGLKLLEVLTRDAQQVQDEVLEEIISNNAKTEYLKHFDLRDKESFKRNVPIVTYEDIKPYMDRIANGDSSLVISSLPITEFIMSSGTSEGKQKLMPSTAQELDRKTFFYNMLVPVMNKHVKGLDEGKAMYLLFTMKDVMTTPCGLKARPVLTSYYHSEQFKNRPFNPYNVNTSPDATILCSDNKQSMFCQILCGLVNRRHVLRVGAIFASAFLRAIKFIKDHHEELCHNIRTGHLSDWITDTGCRKAVASAALRTPDPDAADAVELECRGVPDNSWKGIIKRLWPRTKLVEVIVTGSMEQYIPMLEFYCDGLPLVSTMYGSSECYFGINLNPLCKPCDVCYTLLPNMAFFEFIPVDMEQLIDDEKVDYRKCEIVVDLVNVEIGRYYELLVTTYTGLYRYRVGDILKVTSFHNNSPEFQFVLRRNVILSIDTEKTNEEDLRNAVAKAKLIVESLGFLLADYTAYADTSSFPGHYVLFWELMNDDEDHIMLEAEVLEKCCLTIEESLDYIYRRYRSKDFSIAALEIRVVEKGAFDALMDYCVSHGSSVNQYKTPRCIKSEKAIQILDSRVLGCYFSPDLPSWEEEELMIN